MNFKPNQDSFETIEGITQKAAAQVKKAVTNTANTVATDVKQQFGIDIGQANEQGQGQAQQGQQGKTLTQQQQMSVQDQNKQLLDQTRQNLDRINAEIMKIRRERAQKQQQEEKKDDKKKEEKKQEEQKKKEDPVWKKMLKGKTGSRESNQRSGG